MKEFFGTRIPKLGFGMMRLPRLEDGTTIDIEQTKVMVDKFMEAGLIYVDTAYVYNGSATGLPRMKRKPRNSCIFHWKEQEPDISISIFSMPCPRTISAIMKSTASGSM